MTTGTPHVLGFRGPGSSTRRQLGTWLGSTRLLLFVAGISLVTGAGVASGKVVGWIVAMAILAAILVPLFGELKLQALATWIVASVVAYPFVRVPQEPAILTFDRVWVAAMLAGVLIHGRQIGMARATRLLFMCLVWLAAAYGVRAALTVEDPLTALKMWFDGIVLPLAVFVVARAALASRERVRILAGALTAAGAMLAGIGLAQFVFGFELASRSGGEVLVDEAVDLVRVSGPYQGPETYSLSLVLCLAATLYWIQIRRGAAAYLVGAGVVALEVAAITGTLFRAAWLAAVMVIIAAFGLRPRRFGRILAVAGVVLAVLVLLSAQLEQGHVISIRAQNTENLSGRLGAYERSLKIFAQEPLWGVGVDQYRAAAAPATAVGGVPSLRHPHSSYLGVLAEQGLWGFIPLLAVSLAVWRLLRDLRRRASLRSDVVLVACVSGGAVGYLLMSLTFTMLPYSPSNLFLAVLLGATAARLDATKGAGRPVGDAM